MRVKTYKRDLVDPKFVRRKARQRKLRAIGRILTVIGATVVGLGIMIGTARLVIAGNFMPIKKIEVIGEFRRVLPSEIIETSGVKKGEGLFGVNVGDVKSKLISNPWVKTAMVRRLPPSTLKIDIVEHTPVALTLIGENLWFVDENGKIIKKRDSGERSDYPVITHLKKEDVKTRKKTIEIAKKLSKVFDSSVSQIKYDDILGFVAIMPGGLEIVLGENIDWDGLYSLWSEVKKKGNNPRYVIANERGRLVVGYNPIEKGGEYGQKG